MSSGSISEPTSVKFYFLLVMLFYVRLILVFTA
jgi:hypothetical protein